VTRMTSIGSFLKMIKTRFGETIPMVENVLRIEPFETSQRHLRTVTDYASYKKLYSTLPAALLSALKARVRAGEPKAICELWETKDKTFMAIDFEWSERNQSTLLEWGYAAARCSHLDAVGAWPPDPEPNYRRGHYIVSEYLDRVNKHRPNYPWAYAFGDSQQISRAKLPQVIQATLSSMISPDSETVTNSLVLVAHGIGGDLRRLEEMKIKLPHNVLVIDTAAYERKLFQGGQRGNMQDSSGKPRDKASQLSLTNMLQSLGVDVQPVMHNAGNDAFMSLLGLQLLLDPENTKIPNMRGRNSRPGMMRNSSRSPTAMPAIMVPQMQMQMQMPMMTPYGMMAMGSPAMSMLPMMSNDRITEHDSGGSNRTSSGYFPNMQSPLDPRSGRKVSPLSPPATNGRPSKASKGAEDIGEKEITARLGGMRVASG